jgi:hypothetical protein
LIAPRPDIDFGRTCRWTLPTITIPAPGAHLSLSKGILTLPVMVAVWPSRLRRVAPRSVQHFSSSFPSSRPTAPRPPASRCPTQPMQPAFSGQYRRPLCPPRAGPKRLGARYGFYLEVPRPHLASLYDPRAHWLAVAVRGGGLSPTDERVRGHVTEVTQALWKLSEWSPCHPHV